MNFQLFIVSRQISSNFDSYCDKKIISSKNCTIFFGLAFQTNFFHLISHVFMHSGLLLDFNGLQNEILLIP